ncbi:MAG: 1-phosphofructokinase [Negativibacillus sp.]|nr:1-phosphofructokinase [Negativibacillus sp.]
MIYTVTFNPAIDYVVRVEEFSLGQVNRSSREEIQFGGKGINVSVMLNHLGTDSCALGFLAGFTGKAIEDDLHRMGIRTDFIHLSQGMTRINVKLKAKEETEINGQGPGISQADFQKLLEQVALLRPGDTLVLAGSIPQSLPDDVYERIIQSLAGKDIQVVVDATRDLLCHVLKYRPFLIKPNHIELGEIFDRTLHTDEEIRECASLLQQRGARNVLVSMAGDGAILLDETGAFHKIAAPKGKVKNSVGAGDSMVAGFLAGYLQSRDYETALRIGAAAGSATAFSEGLAQRDEVQALLDRM